MNTEGLHERLRGIQGCWDQARESARQRQQWARHRVLITVVREGPIVEITIEYDGPGLSDQQTVDAMKPGHRIDESAPGYGFGLPITRELAELYGGTFALARSRLGGLTAIVTLPAAG